MDSPNGSHSTSLEHWKLFGERIPRAEIVFFAQLFVCITLIIASIVMLAVHDSNRDYWMVILSSLVGYIMPSPTLPALKKASKPQTL